LLLVQLVALCLLLAGCGSFLVGFVSNPGGPFSVSGTVTIVSFGFIQDPTGLTITFTAVTFVDSGTATTINFCGDQRAMFPINRFLRTDFNIGIHWSVLIAVTVVAQAHEAAEQVGTANDFPISVSDHNHTSISLVTRTSTQLLCIVMTDKWLFGPLKNCQFWQS
jgi:hypothetical protein